MDKKKQIVSMIALIIVIAGGAFYGGIQYGIKKAAQVQLAQGGRGGGNFGGVNGGQRMGGQGGQRQGGMQGSGANDGAGDFSGGEITAKDDTSVTIKTRNGSSQIIFVSPSTTIDKSVTGSLADLNVGQQITANGKSSSDGTLSAQSIQIRSSQQEK